LNQIKAAKYSMDTAVTTKTVILKLLELSPMTDPELCQAYNQMSFIGQAPTTTDQNIRTHRVQLHRLGLVHVVGTVKTPSGRTARIWRRAQ
jgi:predicted ArsR family transcriptional regulator